MEDKGKQRDSAFSSARHPDDLQDPADVTGRAISRARARLGATPPKGGRMPVVFSPRVARGLLGHLISAVNGQAVVRRSSFLADAMGEKIFPENITIVDDPLRRRGLRSRPIDMEGLPAARSQPVENGRISLFMTDLAAARQLGIAPSGHAGRGPGDIPAPTAANLYLTAGDLSPEDLISDIHTGLYVTELSGQGVNTITGDYSRGAAGFMIQNGIITDPVEGATVAGNLKEMFAGLSRADDLNFHYGIDAPTVRIAEMTVAGR